jgi:hypothetical protein
MKIRLLGLLAVSLLLAADDAKKADEAARQIEGVWQGVSLEQDGNKNDDADRITVTIKEGKAQVNIQICKERRSTGFHPVASRSTAWLHRQMGLEAVRFPEKPIV